MFFMAYDLFVSYSTKDKLFVDALVHRLEAENLRCWYAPRDIAAGVSWPTAISEAIRQIPVMLLVFSSNSNTSSEISRELTLAANNSRLVIPVRLENITPSSALEYHLSNLHWLDVYGMEAEAAIARVMEGLRHYNRHFPALGGLASGSFEKTFGPAKTAKNSTSRASRRKITAALALAVVLAVALGLRLSGDGPDDAQAALLRLDNGILFHYAGLDDENVRVISTRLAPLPGSDAPEDYLVVLQGAGSRYDGRIFRCVMYLDDPYISFATQIDGRRSTLLSVDVRGHGFVINPQTGRRYRVDLQYRQDDAGAAQNMLEMYRQGKKWQNPRP